MEVNENFLVNPPKKRRRAKKAARKLFGGLGGAHRPLVFGPKGGPWKRSHRSKRRLAKLENPFGESLMIAGLNPRRRHRNKKHRKTGFARLFGRHNMPKHRRRTGARRRHNPAISLGAFGRMTGLDQISGNMPTLAGGVLGTLFVNNMPGAIGFDRTPFQKYGVQLVSTLGGAAILRQFKWTKNLSGGFIIGGALLMFLELYKEYISPMIPVFPGSGLIKPLRGYEGFENYTPGLPAFGPGYTPYADYGAGYETLPGYAGIDDSGLGAFPIGGDSGFGAFPGDGGAYDMTDTPFTPAEGTSVY